MRFPDGIKKYVNEKIVLLFGLQKQSESYYNWGFILLSTHIYSHSSDWCLYVLTVSYVQQI